MIPHAYKESKTPPPFGLQNSGVLCYFNAMIQMLLSCPAFGMWLERFLQRVESKEVVPTYPQGVEIARLYLEMLYSMQERYAPMTDGGTLSTEAFHLFRHVASSAKSLIHAGRQEDLHEGLLAFLNSIDPEADDVFRVRHTCYIVCPVCQESHVSGMGPGDSSEKERTINMPNIYMDVCGETFTRQSDAEAHIRGYERFPEDYHCEKCGTRNAPRPPHPRATSVRQKYALVRVSEVLLLKFGNYDGKKKRWIPGVLTFGDKSGRVLEYRLVSTIDHRGTRHGGHYYGCFLRPKPPHFHEQRGRRLDQRLHELNEQRQRYRNPPADLVANLAKVENSIRKNMELRDEEPGVFKLDDDQVSYCPSGFICTEFLMYAVYHFFGSQDPEK